mgnify:CR=1 FL=1
MLNNFISGGQVFLHKIRMLRQVLSTAFVVSILAGALIAWNFSKDSTSSVDWGGAVTYAKAKVAITLHPALSAISIGKSKANVDAYSNGKLWKKRMLASSVISSSKFSSAWNKSLNIIQILSLKALSFGACTSIVILLFWSRFGRSLKDEKRKDGSGEILTPEQVARKLKSLCLASDFKIGKMPLVKDMETRHFLVSGSTGSGKTNFIHNILPQVEKKKQPVVVIDQTGEMIAKYYNKERGDIIFNPFDDRSHVWDFWADCSDDESLERFSNILMGFNRRISGSRADPFWEKSATEIFESAVKYQRDYNDLSIERLNTLIRQTDLKVLRQKLIGTAASRYLESENSVTANSILSVLTTSTKPLAYLQDINNQDSFSLKGYFNQVKEGGNSWLFLATKPSNRALTLPLIACLTELALAELMDIGIDVDRRIWFVLDELAALGVLPGLSPLMTEGRKYGACVLAGLQSLNQLYEYYGHHGGSKIFGQFGTLCFFRNQEESIVRMISNMCGTETITRQQKNTSFGANEFRDGVSYNEQQTKKELVTQNNISSLATGECYILLPEPETRLAKVQTPEAKVKAKQEGFVQTTKGEIPEPLSIANIDTEELPSAGNTGDSPIHTSVDPIGNSIISDDENITPETEIKKHINLIN